MAISSRFLFPPNFLKNRIVRPREAINPNRTYAVLGDVWTSYPMSSLLQGIDGSAIFFLVFFLCHRHLGKLDCDLLLVGGPTSQWVSWKQQLNICQLL